MNGRVLVLSKMEQKREKMPKFKVRATLVSELELEIEASSAEEAEELQKEYLSEDFTLVTATFTVDTIERMGEEK